MKPHAATAVAVTAVLATAGCTGADEQPPEPIAPPSATAPSLTYEEAQRKVPLDGTKDVPITWDLAGSPDTDEVVEARRSLALTYWLRGSTDWAPISPVGQLLYTEEHYQKTLAPLAASTNDNPTLGPLWVKTMGVEKTGADQADVTFCTDRGHWRRVKEQVDTPRANLESYRMKLVRTGDGERRWLTDGQISTDGSREKQYGARCREFARHDKP